MPRFSHLLWSLRTLGPLQRLEAALRWFDEHLIAQKGVAISSRQGSPYPEVSGYFIPSLLRWNRTEVAYKLASWLVSIQNEDGSWSDPAGTAPYTFDTGQILKGLLSLVDRFPEFKGPALAGCDWILAQIEQSGRIATPNQDTWRLPNDKIVPEAIHLYVLEPIRNAGERWGIERYTEAVRRSLVFYLDQPGLTEFSTLSHFHAYVIEALIDMGCVDDSRIAMKEIAKLQRTDGFIPAYLDVAWTCSTGLFQYALIWYKLGETVRADVTFDYACSLQNASGGWFGSYGRKANYFPKEEISWAVKYFLDALWWRVRRGCQL